MKERVGSLVILLDLRGLPKLVAAEAEAAAIAAYSAIEISRLINSRSIIDQRKLVAKNREDSASRSTN